MQCAMAILDKEKLSVHAVSKGFQLYMAHGHTVDKVSGYDRGPFRNPKRQPKMRQRAQLTEQVLMQGGI